MLVPPVSARRSPLRALECQSRCAEVRQSSGVSVAARQLNHCGCGNAVAGGSGHCWTLGGDVRTKTGALNDWLPSKLTGCFGNVGGSPRRLGVARNRAAEAFFIHFWGIFYPAGKTKWERSQKGFPSTMEPRIAGSVSRATDSQESPQGTGLVTAGIAPQLFQDLFYSRADAPQLLPPS